MDKRHQDLKKATQQFEGYFLHELLKEMRKTVPATNCSAMTVTARKSFGT